MAVSVKRAIQDGGSKETTQKARILIFDSPSGKLLISTSIRSHSTIPEATRIAGGKHKHTQGGPAAGTRKPGRRPCACTSGPVGELGDSADWKPPNRGSTEPKVVADGDFKTPTGLTRQ